MSVLSSQRLSEKSIPLLPWLLAAIIFEAIIFGSSFAMFEEIGEVFRHAARYSGRLSLFVYLFTFSYFALTYHDTSSGVMDNVRKLVTIFCVMHFIHFGFLAMNVYLNEIPLVPYKLAGGALGYLMILLYPFFLTRIKRKALHNIYFYYLGIVMILTYLARIKGDFEGVTPGPIHYFGLGSVLLAFVVYGYLMFGRGRKKDSYTDLS